MGDQSDLLAGRFDRRQVPAECNVAAPIGPECTPLPTRRTADRPTMVDGRILYWDRAWTGSDRNEVMEHAARAAAAALRLRDRGDIAAKQALRQHLLAHYRSLLSRA